MSKYHVGQEVIVKPTQGAYQKEKSGVVTKVTPKQVMVKIEDKLWEVRFNIETGRPVNKIDQGFPCYCLKD